MLAINSGTPAKITRRRFFSVRSRNQRSTWLSHDDEVGVKCRWNRLWRLSHRCTFLGQPPVVTAAYAASVRSSVAVLNAVIDEIASLEAEVKTHLGWHPDADIISSQSGLGPVLGARMLAEFGDAPDHYHSAKARKNCAGTSPITKQSGKTRIVAARYVHNDRTVDALHQQASCALLHDSDVKAYHDQLRARGLKHNPALRQLANLLVGILHGCLAHGTPYDQATAWAHRQPLAA